MSNLQLYNTVRAVPKTAIKTITAGRLKGFSDINPMWRIEKLTEQFGPCGEGWYYEILNKWLEQGAKDEVCAFVDINLYYRTLNGEWSKPIPGTGGSRFLTVEKNGPYTSDECYKMALTDALSVACKALGFGADVYYGNARSKYSENSPQSQPSEAQNREQRQEPQNRTTQRQSSPQTASEPLQDGQPLAMTYKEAGNRKLRDGRCLGDLTDDQLKYIAASDRFGAVDRRAAQLILEERDYDSQALEDGDLPF